MLALSNGQAKFQCRISTETVDVFFFFFYRRILNQFCEKFSIVQRGAWSETSTHLVTKARIDNRADRTLKFLQAIINRKWIISINWIKECLNKNVLIQPNNYEVLDTNGESGPFRSRNFPKSEKLFEGYELALQGFFNAIPKDDLIGLLKTEGAQVARSVHSLSFRKKSLIIMEDGCLTPGSKKDAERNFQALKVPTLSTDWTLDSISSFQIMPISNYLMHSAAPEEIRQLGYV